jgi:hypothetical protein
VVVPAVDCSTPAECSCGWGPEECGPWAPTFKVTICWCPLADGWIYYHPLRKCWLPLDDIFENPPCKSGVEQPDTEEPTAEQDE